MYKLGLIISNSHIEEPRSVFEKGLQMKKKIVINVPMHGDMAKSKAMRIAVVVEGVISVSVGGENDQLEVIGEGVDSVCLANSLRKKFCYADIVSLDEVPPPTNTSPSPSSSPTPSSPEKTCQQQYPRWSYAPPCQPGYYEYRVYDSGSPNCSIL